LSKGQEEETMAEDLKSEFRVKGEDLIRKVKDLVHEGNVRRIIIKDEKGATFLEIPLTVGVVGVVIAPVLAAVGALAAMASNFTVEVVKRDDPQ
jgi:Flp pilus assembly pilin Flp